VADEIDELDRGELTAVDASASTCGEVQLRVSSSGAGHQIVHVTHAGALPGETVRVTCTFSHGQAAITVAARKRGTPLRALIGKRLQIGFLRSGADQLGGRVTVRFARH